MRSERFVVLGVAPVRREWFARVSKWANDARLPLEFVKCISVNEVASRLETGRAFSALLVDGGAIGLDRDLLDLATTLGCAPIVIDHGLVERDWHTLGAAAVLPERFEAAELHAVLDEVSNPIGRTSNHLDDHVVQDTHYLGGKAVAVLGAGGMGSSTVAMALIQGLAAGAVRNTSSSVRPLLLADMALQSGQAMLHDARDVVPGVTELVESHRLGTPTNEEVAASIFDYPERGYHLLLGLRHQRDWMTVSARALDATWLTLRRVYSIVVADIQGDLDGVEQTGSTDIEDRNRLARTAALQSDLVLAVGAGNSWGIHHLVRTVLALADAGVDPTRILPIVNRAPRQARQRAAITTAISDLLESRLPGKSATASPIFLPERRYLEEIHRDGQPLPSSLAKPLADATRALLDNLDERQSEASHIEEPVLVAPGSLGTWSTYDD